jgi:hypothetical protein
VAKPAAVSFSLKIVGQPQRLPFLEIGKRCACPISFSFHGCE